MANAEQLASVIDGYAELKTQQGLFKVLDFSVGELRMWRFVSADVFTLVTLTPDSANALGAIDIIGSGGCGLRPHGELFRFIATPDEKFRYGAPFASVRGNDTVLTGTQLLIPMMLVQLGDREMLGFITAMIGNLGQFARAAAGRLIGTYGGRLLDGEDEDDAAELFSAAAGH
jgi:hypothetical protein